MFSTIFTLETEFVRFSLPNKIWNIFTELPFGTKLDARHGISGGSIVTSKKSS